MLLSFTLGLHWVALQSVAWTGMFLSRVQTASVADAWRTTFDGKHPCPLCLVVRDGRAAESRDTGTQGSRTVSAPKLDLVLATVSGPSVRVSRECVPLAAPPSFWRSLAEPPPLPPPRWV